MTFFFVSANIVVPIDRMASSARVINRVRSLSTVPSLFLARPECGNRSSRIINTNRVRHDWMMKQHTSNCSPARETDFGNESFRHDYIRHSLDKARSYKPEEVYVPRGEFDSMTSYNKEYTGKRSSRQREMKTGSF